jgi:pyruvate/2-oxoglutarate dehydrogenase complex dihydrolipoamide acyltransferase (E2) component
MPDLGLENTAAVASAWLRPAGAEVQSGERVLEIHAGEVTLDLSAPATGRLLEQLVQEEDPVTPGQLLAVIIASL